ncbi:MAG: type II secretion system protein [Alphaproteobacteria bacterium]|nr:type II secretion system protein [Alphaproteobacteria bacterium]
MRHRTRGFSLVELAMVVAISGLMVGFVLQSQKASTATECYASSRLQLQDIRGAIEGFARANERLPLPAARNAGVEAVTYGREAASPALIDAIGGASFGALPFQALGLNASYAGDCWGNKFTYAVTTALTTNAASGGYPDNAVSGNITLKSSTTSTIATDLAYAVISHGADALGAVKLNYSAAGHGWCAGGDLKHLNCNLAGATVAGATFNNGKNAGLDYFDDLIVFGGKPQWAVDGICGASSNSCDAGTASGFVAGACGSDDSWNCLGSGGGSDAACTLATAPCAVNGVCDNTTIFACSAGTSASNVAGSCGGNATWSCLGSGGGTDATDCTKANDPCAPVNGVCDNTVALGCTAGSATADNGLTACGTTRQWVCAGSNGGTDSGTCAKANTACASCTKPWGGTMASGSSVTAYLASNVACGSSCTSQTRTCTNGVLSGSYTNGSCSVGACASCTLPWGGTLASGSSVTAYLTSSVACGSSCTSQTRSCTNGTLSGSYTNQNCSQACVGCAATTTSWTTANGTCSGDLPAANSGDSKLAADYTAPLIGSLVHDCFNDTWTHASPPPLNSCKPNADASCLNYTLSWTVGGKTCSGNPGITSSGIVKNVSDGAAPNTGSQNFLCDAGAWTPQGAGSCN